MPSKKRSLLAASGAGGDSLYVEDVFSTYLYTGTGSPNVINNGIDLAGEGGLVWIKRRQNSEGHNLFDTLRGVSKVLHTDSTSIEQNYVGAFTSFNSSGFTVDQSGYGVNDTGKTLASWTFRKAEKFFDVVTYTGNAVNGRQIAHNLGSTPGMIVVKRLNGATEWPVYHESTGAGQYLFLSTTDQKSPYDGPGNTNSRYWNNTAPTSTNFSVSNDGWVNASDGTYVAYLFASDAGGYGDDGDENIIKCGSYTTDGSASAQHIDLGFEPQFFMKKKATGADNWEMYDTMRGWSAPNDTYGVSSAVRLYANLNVAEGATTSSPGPTATGMYFPDGGQSTNATYIYIAIRRPMKTPESGTEVYKGVTRTGSTSDFSVDSFGFTGDFLLSSIRTPAGYGSYAFSRLMGGLYLRTYGANAEADGASSLSSWDMDGFSGLSNGGLTNDNGVTYVYNLFKRATGFMDVVAYTGNGTAGATQAHNLGVVPEMMIVKRRDSTGNWMVYGATPNPEQKYLAINLTDAADTASWSWNNTSPTATNFALGTGSVVNGSGGTFIAYLFATLAGVSKVGSYTGTAADLNVDCGFTAGARFILIKRTDTSGDWYTYDSARGISAGNDPYLLLNDTAAEVTNTDYIDPLNSGFIATTNGYSTINVNGGTYIFLAIA